MSSHSHHPLLLGLAFSISSLCACANPQTPSESTSESSAPLINATLPSDADLTRPPDARLFFDPNWQEHLFETPYAGGKLDVIASPDRFPHCGMGEVTAFVRVDGKVSEVPLLVDHGGWPGGMLTLPDSTRSFEVWLRNRRGDCVEWDSNFEANYPFSAHPWKPVVVHFNADWSEVADAPIPSEGVLVIDYDPARLPRCRATDKYGLPAWDIIAHVRLSDGREASQTVMVGIGSGGAVFEKTRGLAVFPLPAGVQSLQVWFENPTGPVNYSPAPQCHEWDSDYGSNYTFPVQ